MTIKQLIDHLLIFDPSLEIRYGYSGKPHQTRTLYKDDVFAFELLEAPTRDINKDPMPKIVDYVVIGRW